MNPNAKKFEIKQLTKADLSTFNSLIDLFNMVFEEEPKIRSEAHSLRILGRDDFIAIAAISENEVLGGLTAYELPMVYSDYSEIFLYDWLLNQNIKEWALEKH